MTTVLQIIDRALEHIQIKAPGETTNAEDVDIGIRALSSLLDAYQLDNDAVVGLTELVYTPTGGQKTVTIGPAGQIVASIPNDISRASFYRVNGIDVPLGWVENFEQYAHEAVKNAQGLPTECYYMRSPTAGTLYLWPAASGTYELHLWVNQEVVTGQTTLAAADSLTLPNGYQMSLEYALAAELCPAFTRPPAIVAMMEQRAQRALRRMKRGNFTSEQNDTFGPHRRWSIFTGP